MVLTASQTFCWHCWGQDLGSNMQNWSQELLLQSRLRCPFFRSYWCHSLSLTQSKKAIIMNKWALMFAQFNYTETKFTKNRFKTKTKLKNQSKTLVCYVEILNPDLTMKCLLKFCCVWRAFSTGRLSNHDLLLYYISKEQESTGRC